MSTPIPEGSVEYWDAATRTYYERQSGGQVFSRPFNEAELAQAEAAVNRAALVDGLTADTGGNYADTTANSRFLALADPSPDEVRQQVAELSRQNQRQARELSALTRLATGRLESTSTVIATRR
ncbi:hypothetical protein ACWC5I_02935 [Kitasatospora sp. NPDC001574]